LDAVAHVFGTFDQRHGARALDVSDVFRITAQSRAQKATIEIEATLTSHERTTLRSSFPGAPKQGIIRRTIGGTIPLATKAGTPPLSDAVWIEWLKQLPSDDDAAFSDPTRAAVVQAPGAPCVYLVADRGTLLDSDASYRELDDFDP